MCGSRQNAQQKMRTKSIASSEIAPKKGLLQAGNMLSFRTVFRSVDFGAPFIHRRRGREETVIY